MDRIQQKVSKVGRRLGRQRFIDTLVWCLLAAMLAAAVWIGVDKFYPLGVSSVQVVGGALIAAVLAAMVIALVRRPSSINAALALDYAFQLKERVSSSLSLTPGQRDTPAGRALLSDTLKRVENIEIAEQFRLRWPRFAWVALPGLIALAIAILVPNPFDEPSKQVKANEQKIEEQNRVKKSAAVLRNRIEEQRRKAKNADLKLAEEVFRKLEQGTRDLSEKNKLDRKQAMTKLNKLADEIKKRREELSGSKEMKNRFKELGSLKKGPADKFADAMKKGDLNKAAKELKELAEQLNKNELSKEDVEALKKQIEQIQKKIEQLANAQERRKQLEQQRKELQEKGLPTDDIDQQLQQLQQQAKQMKQLQQLAQKLGECKQCLDSGQLQQAGQKLQLAQGDLQQLAKDLQELEMLQQALDNLANAKNGMACKSCNGMGCAQCQAFGEDGQGNGNGLGGGSGFGDRPEEKDKTASYNDATKGKSNPGEAVVVGTVDGPQSKGRTLIGLSEAREAAAAVAPDAINNQKLPRTYREHTKKYFDSVSGN